jgi:starch phosphorylase
MRRSGAYDPRAVYYRNTDVQRVVDALNSNRFCEDEPGLFRWIVRSLTEEGDHYFHLADLPDYIRVQRQIEQDFQKKDVWSRKAILNVARIGKFSSDRTITEYARDIWKLNSIRG